MRVSTSSEPANGANGGPNSTASRVAMQRGRPRCAAYRQQHARAFIAALPRPALAPPTTGKMNVSTQNWRWNRFPAFSGYLRLIHEKLDPVNARVLQPVVDRINDPLADNPACRDERMVEPELRAHMLLTNEYRWQRAGCSRSTRSCPLLESTRSGPYCPSALASSKAVHSNRRGQLYTKRNWLHATRPF